jgi:hypothetical protein
MKNAAGKFLFPLASFAIPLIFFRLTSSHALMFDDAGEFALVSKLASIAHPPGAPAYILTGHLWGRLMAIFGMNIIDSLTLLASVSISASSLLLYHSLNLIGKNLQSQSLNLSDHAISLISSLSAISYAVSATTWAWANTIEVYSFQVLAFALVIYGLTCYHFKRKNACLILAAIGIAIGLASHHLTMVIFLPFIPLFFFDRLCIPRLPVDKKKKDKIIEKSFFTKYFDILKNKSFWMLAGMSAAVMITFYFWMYMRAGNSYAFMFGKPATFDQLIYHISGGSYSKFISSTSGSIIKHRIPYFLSLTFYQLLFMLPFFILGMIFIVKKKLTGLSTMIIFYFLFLFIYQLNNNQWSSTDAYLLLPMMVLTFGVYYGAISNYQKMKLAYVFPVLLICQIFFNYPLHDRKTYPVSKDLMHLLDVSAPKNSAILIADWTTVIQYYYYRIAENFRTDLVVLNYDFKFTQYEILPKLYPEFYQKIKPEYDKLISLLGKEHPEQLNNTGCDLSTPELSAAFRSLLLKSEQVCKNENRFFLTDPHAHHFFVQQKFYDGRRYVSGCFSSSLPGDSISSAEFLNMKLEFLDSPLLLTDPAALDKLVDFQAMLDRHIEFYTVNHDPRQQKAEETRDRILRLQRAVKKKVSFAYQLK